MLSRLLSTELAWLLREARPFRELIGSQLLLVFLASLLGLLDPLVLKWLIDSILPWREAGMLPVLVLVFFGIYAFQYGFTAVGVVLDAYVRQRLMLRLRLSLMRHLQEQGAAFYDRRSRGDLVHRLEADIEQVCELGGNSLAALVRVLVMTTLSIVIMALLSWRLTLIVLPLVPVMLWVRRWAYPRLRRASDRYQQASARRLSFVQDHLQAMQQIQLLDACAGERRRFVGVARDGLDAFVSRRAQEAGLDLATQLVLVAASALVLGFGGAEVLAGSLSVGGLVAFYTYLSRIFGPAQTLVMIYSSAQRSSAGVRRLMEIFDEPPVQQQPVVPLGLPNGALAVELTNLGFTYGAASARGDDNDSAAVLDGFDLRIEAGERVALVGRSGSGKSTVSRLLTRSYDAAVGRVSLGGVDICRVAPRQLRRRVALVPQESVIFDTSLRDNLRLAAPQASDADLRRVLDLTLLWDVTAALPEDWHTALGHRGSRLSGGQRQRLALARAVLQNPGLLILDEATSALDGITEQQLLERLQPFFAGRTVIVIAHHRAAVRDVDRIVLLDEGRVAAAGDHQQLQAGSTLYRQLWQPASDQPSNESTDEPLRVAS